MEETSLMDMVELVEEVIMEVELEEVTIMLIMLVEAEVLDISVV